MGLWTEAILNCKLNTDTPQQVIDVLNYLINPIQDMHKIDTPSHSFFEQAGWEMTLAMDCAYFPGEPISVLVRDEWTNDYHLSIHCKVKYGHLITELLEWLTPHIDTQGFLGYRRDDESDEITLIYLEHNKAFYDVVTSTQRHQVSK